MLDRSALCSFSSVCDKEFFRVGSVVIESYHVPFLKWDLGALICLNMTGSLVTILLGATLTGEPSEVSVESSP